MNWGDLNIDERVITILEELEYLQPFESQSASIPAILEGKDVFVHSATGSGKTVIFLATFLHFIAQNPQYEAVILSPTHELCQETYQLFREVLEISKSLNIKYLISVILQEKQQVLPYSNLIISTPFLLQKEQFNCQNMKYVIIDEADLMFSMLQDKALKEVLQELPSNCEKLMLSATLNDDIKSFSAFSLKEPVLVSLLQEDQARTMKNYYLTYKSKEVKFLQLYCLTKLNILKGNTIIFTKSQKQGYRVQLFLQAFSLQSTIFDPKMPQSVRFEEIDQFNTIGGIIIIAGKSDDSDATRGLDFNQIDFVLVFDAFESFTDYQHAIGRCCRGLNADGASFLFCGSEEQLGVYQEQMERVGQDFSQFALKSEEIEPFAYRVHDVFNKLTDQRVEDQISAAVKKQLLSSEHCRKLLNDDKNIKALQKIKNQRIQPLSALPDYLQQAAKALQSRQQVGTSRKLSMQQNALRKREKRAKLEKLRKDRKNAQNVGWKKSGGRLQAAPAGK